MLVFVCERVGGEVEHGSESLRDLESKIMPYTLQHCFHPKPSFPTDSPPQTRRRRQYVLPTDWIPQHKRSSIPLISTERNRAVSVPIGFERLLLLLLYLLTGSHFFSWNDSGFNFFEEGVLFFEGENLFRGYLPCFGGLESEEFGGEGIWERAREIGEIIDGGFEFHGDNKIVHVGWRSF